MTDGSYRQKRCPHGWTGDQCPECIKLAAKDAEIERLTALVELGAEKLTGFMGRCAEAEAALRDFYAMVDSSPIMKIEAERKHAEALRLAGIKA